MTKRAIVMGATSGIGMQVAKLLAAEGWDVAVAGRRTERLQQLVEANEGITCYEQIDVTGNEAAEQLLTLIDKHGGMDIYFHSSGIGWQNKELDAAKELATTETNALGFVRMVTTAYNYMAAHGGGHIAAISSIAGTKGLGAAPAYSATKAMQQHYLEGLDQLSTLRKLPIIITDIRPGFVATDLIAGSNFPLQLNATQVARTIVKAIHKRKPYVTIDRRYRLLVFFWRGIPRRLWTKLKIG